MLAREADGFAACAAAALAASNPSRLIEGYILACRLLPHWRPQTPGSTPVLPHSAQLHAAMRVRYQSSDQAKKAGPAHQTQYLPSRLTLSRCQPIPQSLYSLAGGRGRGGLTSLHGLVMAVEVLGAGALWVVLQAQSTHVGLWNRGGAKGRGHVKAEVLRRPSSQPGKKEGAFPLGSCTV